MASFKIGRVQEDMLRELTAIMREEIKDPRITPDLTVVRAELSGDMGHCTAYISSLTCFTQAGHTLNTSLELFVGIFNRLQSHCITRCNYRFFQIVNSDITKF